MNKMVGAADFEAHCARIMDDAAQSGQTVVITKDGRPYMELKPVAEEKPTGNNPRLEFGFMKGSITFLPDDDDFSALAPDWEEQWEKK